MSHGSDGDDAERVRNFRARQIPGFPRLSVEEKVRLLREIADRADGALIENVLVDAQTAGAIVLLSESMSSNHRSKLFSMAIQRVAAIAWRLVEAMQIRERSDSTIKRILALDPAVTANVDPDELLAEFGLVTYQRATALAFQLILSTEANGHGRRAIWQAMVFGSVHAALLSHIHLDAHRDGVVALWKASERRPRESKTLDGCKPTESSAAEALDAETVQHALAMMDAARGLGADERETLIALTVGAVLMSHVLQMSLDDLDREVSHIWALHESPRRS